MPNGQSILAPLPPEVQSSFGPSLKNFIVHQYHVCNVPENKIKESLKDIGLDISEGTIHNILMETAVILEPEAEKIREEGLKSSQIRTDDTGARYQKENWFTSVIQNDFFAYFKTTPTKSRNNFLNLLQGSNAKYVLNETTFAYLRTVAVKPRIIPILRKQSEQIFETVEDWTAFLVSIGITKYNTGIQTLRYLEEAALLGGAFYGGVNLNAVLMSDGAPQFKKIFSLQALCWVHMIRSIKKIIPKGDTEAAEIAQLLDQVWGLYAKLKCYSQNPIPEHIATLTNAFDMIFEQTIISQALQKALLPFIQYKSELLRVLQYPETPLHNNSSERDIRPAVIKRKISGPTRNDQGRNSRDTGLTIVKTCRKLGISPYSYIADRLSYRPIQMPLHEIIRQRVQTQRSPPQKN